MRKTRAFTLIELLVVIAIIALLIGILLPALGAARRTARQMVNSTQVRGIHQGMVIFSRSNGGWYPGVSRHGIHVLAGGNLTMEPSYVNKWAYFTDPPVANAQIAPHNDPFTPAYRFRILLEERMFAGAYAISPQETKKIWSAGLCNTKNYSFSMLALEFSGSGLTGQELKSARGREWKTTENSQAVVLSDRPINSGGGISSVHSDPKDPALDEWRGSVGWNDNHVTFETTFRMDQCVYDFGRPSTVNAAYQSGGRKITVEDNLFTGGEAGVNHSGGANDAFMVYGNATSAF